MSANTFTNAPNSETSPAIYEGFYGGTPVAQRVGSVQGTFTTTMTQSTGWGFLSSTAADAAIALLTEIRAVLVAVNLMKGSS